jgi:DNA-directed RNA polymerase subunit RPC12/RpoP
VSTPRSIGQAPPAHTSHGGLMFAVGSMWMRVKEVEVRCTQCASTVVVDSSKSKYRCPTGHRQAFVACQRCGAPFQIPGDEKDRTTRCSSCGEPWKSAPITAWDWCDYWVERQTKVETILDDFDLVIRGITLAAAGGTQIPNRSLCLVGFGAIAVTITPEQRQDPVDRIPYAQIHSIQVDGTSTRRNAGMMGGGFGIAGAAEGMLAASVINSLTARTTVNTILRIAAASSEFVFVSDTIESKSLEMFLTPVYPRVRQARAPEASSTSAPQASTSSLADELGKLAKLRDDGVLSDAEFAAAKGRLLDQM